MENINKKVQKQYFKVAKDDRRRESLLNKLSMMLSVDSDFVVEELDAMRLDEAQLQTVLEDLQDDPSGYLDLALDAITRYIKAHS